MPKIHPTAIVSGELECGENVEIGPGCVIAGRVKLGDNCKLIGGVYLTGPITIGARATIYPGVCIGFPGQDYKFTLGMPTAGVAIGDDAIIREHVTIHAATKIEAPTRVGDKCMLMAGAHMGHDSAIGNNVILVNNTALAGFSSVADSAILSASVLVHQFNRVGRLAMCSGGCQLTNEMPPFCIGYGRSRILGLNLVGLRRAGIARDEITMLREAYRASFRVRQTKPEMLAALEARRTRSPLIAELADFVRTAKRPLCTHGQLDSEADEA